MALSPPNSVPFEHKGYNDRKEPRLVPDDLINCEDIIEIAKDKWKSRSLQRSLMEHDPVMTDLIYRKALPVFHQLLNDQYGNYLSQKILEHCADHQFNAVFDVIKDDFIRLANEVHGTRAVQKFVEEAVRRNRSDAVVECLRPNLEPLSRSITGFHVIVKLLEKLPLQKCEEILAVLCKDAESVVALGVDQWGCCVLKTCVDTAQGARAELIHQAIIDSSLLLIQDAYGNYVVQHLLQNDAQQSVLPQMIEKLKDHMLELCQQKFSSNVLEKLLTTASEQHCLRLINCIIQPTSDDASSVIENLLFHQYGNYVLQQLLSVAKEPEYSLIVDKVRPFVHDVLRTSFVQGGDPAKTGFTRKGNTGLAAEQAQRLALKLVKRFPALIEGLEDGIRQAITSPNNWGTYADWNNYDWTGSPSTMYGGYPANMWDSGYYWPPSPAKYNQQPSLYPNLLHSNSNSPPTPYSANASHFSPTTHQNLSHANAHHNHVTSNLTHQNLNNNNTLHANNNNTHTMNALHGGQNNSMLCHPNTSNPLTQHNNQVHPNTQNNGHFSSLNGGVTNGMLSNGKMKSRKSIPTPVAPPPPTTPPYNHGLLSPPPPPPAEEKAASTDSQVVGRVVGYWPHYTIAYDAEPAAA